LSLPRSFARRAQSSIGGGSSDSGSGGAESIPGFRLALDPFCDSVDAVILWLRSGYGFAVRVQSAAEAELAVLAFEEADSRLEVVQQRGSPRPERALDIARALRTFCWSVLSTTPPPGAL
jgi:hypothetical protein